MKISKLKNASRALALSLSFPFLVLSLALPALPAEGRDVYVRLANDPAKVALTSDEPMTLIDAANKSHTLGKSAVLTRSGSSLVSGKDKFPLPARVSGGLLGYNGRKYRGLLLLTKNFVLLNVLNVEDYIQGVLPVEASAAWPKEYLKVQAILSRTYALRQSLNRSARGYDVTDDTSTQVYRGAGVEAAASNQVVRESAGQVLTYGNDLAFTFFHSDSGGHTADNAHVWGRAVPYLKGVKEPVRYDSPNADWSVRLSSSQVEAALSKLGRGVG
ncbi:MAG: SpoIID/LytB domain-containing protein, partial [Synergistaceae bacterium]|nr:SpoIID/LytB domain-containing protein [Synergistaceae bacterium]